MDYGLLKARGTLSGNIFRGDTTLGPTGGPAFQGFGDDGGTDWGELLFDTAGASMPGSAGLTYWAGDFADAYRANKAEVTPSSGGVDPVVQAYNDCVAKGGGWNNATETCGPAYAPMPNCWPKGIGPQPPGTAPLPACTAAQVAQIGKDPNGNLVSVGPTSAKTPSACLRLDGSIDEKCLAAQGKGTGGTGPTPKPILPTPAPVVEDASVWSSPLLWGGLLLAAGVGAVVYKKRKAKRLGYR